MSLHHTPTSGIGLIPTKSYRIKNWHCVMMNQPALPPAINAYMTIPRVTLHQTQDRQITTTINNPSVTIPH